MTIKVIGQMSAILIILAMLNNHAKSEDCKGGKNNILLVVDEEQKNSDTVSPDKPVIGSVEVIRGEDVTGTLCVSVGMLGFKLIEARDNMTLQDSMGFYVELVSGDDPKRVSTYNEEGPIMAEEGTLWVNFGDDRTKPIDFTFRIASVDQAGNVGEWSSPIKVTHPGIKANKDGGGCSSVATSDRSIILLMLVLIVAIYWRRRNIWNQL